MSIRACPTSSTSTGRTRTWSSSAGRSASTSMQRKWLATRDTSRSGTDRRRAGAVDAPTIERQPPPGSRERLFSREELTSDLRDVSCLRALRLLEHVELDAIALGQ